MSITCYSMSVVIWLGSSWYWGLLVCGTMPLEVYDTGVYTKDCKTFREVRASERIPNTYCWAAIRSEALICWSFVSPTWFGIWLTERLRYCFRLLSESIMFGHEACLFINLRWMFYGLPPDTEEFVLRSYGFINFLPLGFVLDFALWRWLPPYFIKSDVV